MRPLADDPLFLAFKRDWEEQIETHPEQIQLSAENDPSRNQGLGDALRARALAFGRAASRLAGFATSIAIARRKSR